MNTFLCSLAVVFPLMVPTWPSIVIALLLVHLTIRLRSKGCHAVIGVQR